MIYSTEIQHTLPSYSFPYLDWRVNEQADSEFVSTSLASADDSMVPKDC